MKSGYLPNGDIACAGFYSNIGSSYKTNSIAGAFYITVDQESTNVKLQNYKAFDDDFLSRFMSERDVEKGHEIQNITLRNLHFLNDGSAILLAEEYSAHNELIALSFDDGYYTTSQVIGLINYWFDNIVIVKIDPDGIIKWADLILKKQHTREDAGQYSSFASAFIGDKIYLIYNDNPKNLTADPGSVYKFRKNSDAVTICAEINPDGNIKQKALFSAEESAVLIKPKACQQVENDMVIYGEKRKKCRWGLIEFPSN